MWYRFARFVCAAFFFLTHHRVIAHHAERIPSGAAIICPNHTSLRDPIYLAIACGKHIRLRFMAKSKWFDIPFIGKLFRSFGAFPVKRGTADIESIRRSIRILMDGGKLLIFPEGTRVTEGRDVEAKAGAALLAAKTGAPLVPVYIKNARSFFKHTHVTFGNPFTVSGNRAEQNAAAKRLKDEIEAMK